MTVQNFQWPEEVPYEQKLYYLIRHKLRRRDGAIYLSNQSFSGQAQQSAERFFRELEEMEFQSRGIIPPNHREFYNLPEDYEKRVAGATAPELPADWQELYLCGARALALPKKVDPITAALATQSFGDNPLESYLASNTKSFEHWIAAAKYAKEHNLLIPLKPKGRIPEKLQETLKEFISDVEGPAPLSRFEQWKQDWVNGVTSAPWRGRPPVGAEYPPGYKTGKMREQELLSALEQTVEDPEAEILRVKAALLRKLQSNT